MYFDDWQSHPNEGISKHLLWEYDTSSPKWDWKRMDTVVVARVIERGWPGDYYAMFHIYGGIERVREIVRRIPSMNDRDMCWCCALFNLQKEELWSFRRRFLRRELLASWNAS